MKTIFALFATAAATTMSAAPLIPVEPGTTWKYKMTHEAGDHFDFPNQAPAAEGKILSEVAYRLDGIEKTNGKDMLKFEMHRDGLVSNTDMMTVDDRAINCWQRTDVKGEVTTLNPPQPIVIAPFKAGATWNFDTTLAGATVHQHYAFIGEEDVKVPAGAFRAFHVHGQQDRPNEMTIDRWFVKGTGIVKDVTATRNGEGQLISRISLELMEPPKVAPRPAVKSKTLAGSVSKEPGGPVATKLDPATKNIYARWQGRGLAAGAKIRVVWIAEDVGDVAPAHYKIDESNATATDADSSGMLTLSRPEDGWAEGTYRVEFYLDDELIDTVKLTIGK